MAVNFTVPEVNPSTFFYHNPLLFCNYTYFIFSFPFPSILSIFKLLELSEKIVIPTEQPHLQCLGPMGDPDPTDLINAETNRIPFRAKNFSLALWKDSFRSWTNPTKGWKDWFFRVSKMNEVYWGARKIDQCIRLSIADMERNESMLIAASYIWSDTFNSFIFSHGPASPTLADVFILTGLDVATADDGQLFGCKAKFKVETRNIGGWSGYIQKHQ